MLPLESLKTLDRYIWLGTGVQAASSLGCHQSTICRRLRDIDQAFARCDGEQAEMLIAMERHVHQSWRFMKRTDLRVHLYRWTHCQRATLPRGWIFNPPSASITRQSSLDLLRSRVIDAVCVPSPMLPAIEEKALSVIPIFNASMYIFTDQDCPLVHERNLTAGDIAASTGFQSLDFVPPEVSQCSSRVDNQIFADQQQTTINKFSRYWGMELTPYASKNLSKLDYTIPHPYREFLVVHAEWREHECVQELASRLSQHLIHLSQTMSD